MPETVCIQQIPFKHHFENFKLPRKTAPSRKNGSPNQLVAK